MYIYGGAYPENHLIFTAPTLFTDTPSSEDMLLLASILGEVKPPVASREDIDAAGGISKVGEEMTKVEEGDRCLVCLSEYEHGEECRTLSGCGHLFHRECIDQVISPSYKRELMISGSDQEEMRVHYVEELASPQKSQNQRTQRQPL